MAATQELRSDSSTAPSPDELPLPRKFDRYDLLKKLATGGMAEIYLAKQSGLEGFEKVVVLKRILSHLAQDEEFVSMFLDEARIAAKLSHPNIVQIYDLGKADSTYYIAMEYVSGRNVQHIIGKQQGRGEPIPVEHVCRVVAGVCDGLHYAHSRKDYDGTPLNIVHRDISPQNILVSFAGGVKVVDFGIAKASTQLAQTRAGVLKGKYAYMSPEQVRGAKVDHRSDLFAVGLVFYEMLTGTRAFERDSSLKTLKAIVQEKPLNPRELNPEVPMEVVKLLSKALEKNPDRRYKTAQEMQLAIEDYLESSPKKSNNVRLSRYMYDLFDDELNSADGTMVVKGIGEVIIPASQGQKLMPRMEEEIDHKTLSAALLPARNVNANANGEGAAAAAAPAPKVGSNPPQKKSVDDVSGSPKLTELQRSKPQPAAAAKQATPPPKAAVDDELPPIADDEDVDGKTMPAYDADNYERERAARLAGAPPGAVAKPDARDEDRTTAGVVPSSVKTPKSPGRGAEGDALAAELLAKVDAMAMADEIATKTGMPAMAMRSGSQGPKTDERPVGWDATEHQKSTKQNTNSKPGASELEAMVPKESMIVGPNGRIDGNAGIRPPARAGSPTGSPTGSPLNEPTSDTPQGTPPARTPPVARKRATTPATTTTAKLPPMFYAALAGIFGLVLLSLVGLVVILVTFKGGNAGDEAVEYGVAMVTTEPSGAKVFIDGEDTLEVTPMQASVPRDREFKLMVQHDGYKIPDEKPFKLDGKGVLQVPTIILEKK